jgi:hypothetical protein
MMIDDDTLKELLRINDELMQLCKFLNEKHDMETSSRLIPLVYDLTHILIEAGRTTCTDAAPAPLAGKFDLCTLCKVQPCLPSKAPVEGQVEGSRRFEFLLELTIRLCCRKIYFTGLSSAGRRIRPGKCRSLLNVSLSSRRRFFRC